MDISEDRELCKEINGDGFFVKVVKNADMYDVHLCKLKGTDVCFNCVFHNKNEDAEFSTDEIQIDSVEQFNNKLYAVIVIQILNYLSSTEPDIRESEQTQNTYKPSSDNNLKPKNKFSEVRKWNVGVRFGNAYRTWSKQQSKCSSSNIHHRGTKVRPHCRKAHWSHYWYGSGNNKVRRPKWIAESFVNADKGKTPAVIHKVAF